MNYEELSAQNKRLFEELEQCTEMIKYYADKKNALQLLIDLNLDKLEILIKKHESQNLDSGGTARA
ncbi:hypothetical protein FW774_05965 [Pedobacter sp. BS3]|uniref:hypothetical protein n=1 Tax=Pedobacter sp. BS3 TaxID=2567937 RepID=UPI0011EE87E2|nr:hypothetical protein [Pedobacter sp. BS3]TZF84532.1 hypothetical protein FW774_05965 [Pedobacter sp. BS3]